MVMSSFDALHRKRNALASPCGVRHYMSYKLQLIHVKPCKNSVFSVLSMFVSVYALSRYNAESNNSKLITSNKNAKLCKVGRVDMACTLFIIEVRLQRTNCTLTGE